MAACEDLLRAEGGTLTADALSVHLGSTPHAFESQRRSGSLLAVLVHDAWHYPAWQLAGGRLVDGSRRCWTCSRSTRSVTGKP